ncbi:MULTISPECIES: thiaminase II [Solibacillus]|uniref:Aminopyrimidine aminohydrolase n=1 Tax=Solibacillus merdavium TaxID=2762218 RepID=A0ABR8XLP1_9BACL|nr:thiaminase II [Solibacillus merdavium]MBD8032856.1 thiaminase II [Solibacillus merdavium]
MDFCGEVRKQTEYYWEASLKHPFVQGIADGTLELEKFKFYMLQDSYYLKHYMKLLAMLAAKANEDEDVAYFLETANFIREAELELHRSTFNELQVTPEEISNFEPAPAAYNYVSHMYQAFYTGMIADAYAAILPCPWLYQEIGAALRKATPGVKLYQQWIDLYASAEMEQTIEKQKEMMNRFAQMPGNDERELTAHFKRSCYYEWQFWEMSWTCQDWQQEVYRNEHVTNL